VDQRIVEEQAVEATPTKSLIEIDQGTNGCFIRLAVSIARLTHHGGVQDIEDIASCMPGASITERIDDKRYNAEMIVDVGAATLVFRGDIEVTEIDAASRRLRLVAKGSDHAGASTAAVDLTAQVQALDGGMCALAGSSAVMVDGKAAALGKPAVQAMADRMLAEFTENFAGRVEGLRLAAMARAAVDFAEASQSSGWVDTTPLPPLPAPRKSSGLALLWSAFKGWLGGLFGRRSARDR